MKLHLKTALLVSAITLAVMVALLVVISARLVDLLRADEIAVTEATAGRLAEHLAYVPSLSDAEQLQNAVGLVRSARLDFVGVRVWKASDGGFHISWSTTENTAPAQMPSDIAEALRQDQSARLGADRVIETSDSIYRYFVPITREGKVIGAVEISDRLDNLPKLLKRSLGTVSLLAAIAVALISLATYTLFRDLVYRPIEQLLSVIARAKTGQLDVQAPAGKEDELGRLAQEFNSLLSQLHEMTGERERQQEILRERVQQATTQLQQRNEQLAQANQELWHSSRKLTQLERLAAAGQTAAQFAHEVGTPLNLISCHAQLLPAELQTNPDAVRERADIIVAQTERIERIVRQMLDRTRAETAELIPLDLNALIRRISTTTAPALNEKNVSLELALDEQLPPIAGNSDKLQQVFINLINNALDAMPQGGQLTMRTQTDFTGDNATTQVNVYVSDTGHGMTTEVQAHIFDPLYTTKEPGKGSGLGLVVVHQVMAEHGGRVTVESAPQQGARFHLQFPALAHSHTTEAAAVGR